MGSKHLKYGAVGFRCNAAPSQINRFIRDLPDTNKQSMYQVAEELKSAGLIETTGNSTHKHSKFNLNSNS